MFSDQFIRGWIEMPRKLCGQQAAQQNEQDGLYFRETDFFRFFCCFLAFNHMYDGFNACQPRGKPFFMETRKRIGYDAWRQEYKMKWRRCNRESIMSFADYVIKTARRSTLSTSLESVPDLFFSPVYRRNPVTRTDEPEDDLVNDIQSEMSAAVDNGYRSRLTIIRALLRIYQVRCNLFHGDKDSSKDHDRELVKAGADYLERFIMLCITDLYGVLEY